MIRRFSRYVIEILVALSVLAAVGLGMLVMRLEHGPLSLSQWRGSIGAALTTLVPGLSFDVEQAEIRKGRDAGDAVELRLRGVTIRNDDHEVIGALTSVRLGYGWKNILELAFVPRSVRIKSPSVHITRFPAGHIGFNLQGRGDQKTEGSDIPELAHMMAAAPQSLRVIEVEDAWILYRDAILGFDATVTKGRIDLRRSGGRINGIVSMHVSAPDFDQDVSGTIGFDPLRDVSLFSVDVKDFKPNKLMALLPEVPTALNIAMMLDMTATVMIDSAFVPLSVTLDMTAKNGAVSYPPYIPDDVAIRDFAARASYNPIDKSVVVDRISFGLLEESSAELSLGRRAMPDGGAEISVGGVLKNLPMQKLGLVWPAVLAPDAQKWVTKQIPSGTANRATVDLVLTRGADGSVALKNVGGVIDFENLTVDYLPPMQPVVSVNGRAVYDRDNFTINIASGKIHDTAVYNSLIDIAGMSADHQTIAMKFNMDGPLRDMIAVIESKPLEFPQSMGLRADQFTGRAVTRLNLEFPLRHDLSADRVRMKTRAVLDDASVKNIFKNLSVSGSGLMLEADTDGMALAGRVRVANASADIIWREHFKKTAAYKTDLLVNGSITPDLLRDIGLVMDDVLTGSAQAQVALQMDAHKKTTIMVNTDLKKAGLVVPHIGINKKEGTEGTARADIALGPDGSVVVRNIQGAWKKFNVTDGSIALNATGDILNVTLKNLESGRMKADIVASSTASTLNIDIQGDTLDFSDYWGHKSPPDPTPDMRTKNIRVRAKRAYLDPSRPLLDVRADMQLRGDDLITADITARTDKNGKLTLVQRVNANGARSMNLAMDNAGQILNVLDMTDSVQDGTLRFSGSSTPSAPSAIAGRMTLDDFTLVRAPVLARLINSFSLAGLGELLNGRGIYFGRMQSWVILESPTTIRLKDGKMAGASLGLSFAGRVFRDKGTLSLKGTIVPIDGLNKAVGKIPLIGQILTGFKGQGLIAATYKLKGDMANPDVTVNPLSVFTPGILRSIFFEE